MACSRAVGCVERFALAVFEVSHFLTRQKTRRKKATRLSALRRAFPFGRGMNRKGPKGHPGDSPARRAQTTIHSDRVLASAPDSPERARPGDHARIHDRGAISKGHSTDRRTRIAANPAPRRRIRSRSHPFPISSCPNRRTTQGRGALHDDPDCSAIARIARTYRPTDLRTLPPMPLRTFRPSYVHTAVPGQAKNRH